VRRLIEEFRASERRVCGLMEIPRMSYRYRSRRDDSELRERLLALAREKPRYGYRRLHVLLRRGEQPEGGERINHKRLWRVYRDLGLSVRRTRRKRLQRMMRPRPILTAPNQEWAVDFANDVAASGRRLRIFSVVDSYTRECLALEVDTSLPSRRVTRVLAQIIEHRGTPVAIRSDNGPELSSRHFLAWCIERKIDAIHIQPGKPTQNAFVESFHGRLRDECLNVSWFWNLLDARRKIAAWRIEYNCERPHSALGYRTPIEFANKAASLSLGSNTTRPDQPQGCPSGSAVAPTPASALIPIRPCEGRPR
jgi:putative transposase